MTLYQVYFIAYNVQLNKSLQVYFKYLPTSFTVCIYVFIRVPTVVVKLVGTDPLKSAPCTRNSKRILVLVDWLS
jgi:hypothetical protein